MFHHDVNIPCCHPWNGVPDIRKRQQIAEQSPTFEDRSFGDVPKLLNINSLRTFAMVCDPRRILGRSGGTLPMGNREHQEDKEQSDEAEDGRIQRRFCP
jgi:hypothetical protein